jgi:hypothetical protein
LIFPAPQLALGSFGAFPVQKDGMNTAADRHAMFFMQNACQYYATARFAMHAQCIPVCGNLFHHPVEMILKGGLARKRKVSDLKDMGQEGLSKVYRMDCDRAGHARNSNPHA